MTRRLADPDMSAAALFAAFGAIGAIATRDLALGTTLRMGPRYLPLVVSILLIVLSVALALRVAFSRDPEPMGSWHLGPIAAVIASLGAFALLIEPAGLVGATIALLIVSRLAERPFRPWESAVVAIAGAGFSAVVFVELLRLPLALWPA